MQHDLTTRSFPPASGVSGVPSAPIAAKRALSVAVGRAMGAVVVTLRGALDERGSDLVDDILVDLIDNQGNLAVIVDLRTLECDDPVCLETFRRAAGSAARRGGTLTLADPSDALRALLRSSGMDAAVRMTRSRGASRDGSRPRAGEEGVPKLGAASPPTPAPGA